MDVALPRKDGRSRAPRTEDAILDAAEALIGARGPLGVSLRQIAAAAGSSNPNAVQYHFKDKETLIDAIFQRRFRTLETKRGVMLAKAVQEGREREVRTLLEIICLPISEETDARGRASYANFTLGLRIFDELTRWRSLENSPPIMSRVETLLRASLSHLPDDVYFERLKATATAFTAAAVDWDRQVTRNPSLAPARARHLSLVLDFAAAGMTAPIAPPPACG